MKKSAATRWANLQKLIFISIDVGEHAQRLHGRRAQILGFVNDQQDSAALPVFVDQKALEGVITRHGRQAVIGQSERQHDPLCQVGQIGVGVGDHAYRNLVAHLFEQAADQRGFAAPDVAADHREASPVVDGVLQHGVGERMPLAHIEKVGVWLNRERFLFQAVEGFIHVQCGF